VAIYARVSPTQKDDLERQLYALREWVRKTLGEVSVIEIKDISSGLKEDRRGLKKLIELAKRRQIDAVVAYKDRLTRFGFEVKLFKAYGVNVIVAFQDEKGYTQELVEDLVEIVKSFTPRIYGQEYEKVVKCVEDVEKDG
jgi:predicted site-specific integrase-resolvase